MNDDKRFDRLKLFYGDDSVNSLSKKSVLILGIGGVGGYVVEALARSNVGTLILVDYDIIDITNINRQIIATTSNIGRKKVDCFKERIKEINPLCKVIIVDKFIDESNYLDLFNYNIDFVADCCDSIKTKEKIIEYCLINKIDIISSMSTGNRCLPELLTITDIKNTSYDPIAKRIRKYLRDNNINKKLTVMWSKEIPKGKIHGKIPTTSFVPSSAGLLIAGYIINKLVSNCL